MLLILSNNVWQIEFLLLIIVIFYFIRNYFKNVLKTEEYTILTHLLTANIKTYKNKIYLPKYNKLVSTYDLDKNSQTNANKLFTEQLNILLHESCNDIIINYLPSDILIKLYKYYSQNNIIMIILSDLED